MFAQPRFCKYQKITPNFKMLTAQNIIDAVITQSIQGGSGPDGLKTTEELELVKATLAAKAQHEKLE